MHITPAASGKAPTPRPDINNSAAGAAAADDAQQGLGDGMLSDHMPVKGGAPLVKEAGVSLSPRMLHKSPIPDLVMGPLLGKGGYGRVFRGVHKGQEVAVKVRSLGRRGAL